MKTFFRLTVLTAILGIFSFAFYQLEKPTQETSQYYPVYQQKPINPDSISEASTSFAEPSKTLANTNQAIAYANYYPGSLKHRGSNALIFGVDISEEINPNAYAYLEYEYWGVADAQSLCKSINDNIGFGGRVIIKDTVWHTHREEVPLKNLRKGNNSLRFSMPEECNYAFNIRNIGLIVQNNAAKTQRQIHVNQPSTAYYFKKYGYLNGFLSGEGSEEAVVLVNGEKARFYKGVFEELAQKPEDAEASWEVLVEAIYPDGEKLALTVQFDKEIEPDYYITESNNPYHIAKDITAFQTFEIALENASIYGSDSCLNKNEKISITALRNGDFACMKNGMTNVTAGASAYRFLPHGTQFENAAYISLAYDESLLPAGYTVHDIVSYYYDEDSHEWIALAKDSIDIENQRIISRTNHFTDFVNAIIQVPESPESQAFVPTSLKKMAYADPMSGVNQIQPPSANNSGTASLSYPLQLPAGRNGMQPQLAVTYSSDAGTGWLGEGWNIQTPAITVETRWGVPTYNALFESESYLVNGEQVLELEITPNDTNRLPLVHMQAFRNRNTSTDTTIYSYRVEGAFHRIIRHGTNPSNYWWEVIDKQGTHYYYGKYSSDSNVNPNCILYGPDGIAHWALAEVRDIHGNYMTYHYTPSTYSNQGSGHGGKQIVLDSINYTRDATNNGAYTIVFNSSNQSNKSISGRYGFLEYKDKRLDDIIINYNGQFVRRYYFDYTVGAYNKYVLKAIADITDPYFDTKENELCGEPTQFANVLVHCFDYYTEKGLNFGSKIKLDISAEDTENCFGGLFQDPLTQSLGRSKSTTGSLGGSICFGMGVNVTSKINSIGLNLGGSYGTLKDKVQFMDLNGDGITDKIVRNASNFSYYQGSLNSANEVIYNTSPETLSDLPSLGKNWSKSFRIGGELQFDLVAVEAAASYIRTWNTQLTRKYFADVNGDGYVDYIDKGKVYFNFPDANNKPTFYAQTNDPVIVFPEDTCYSILFNGQIDPAFNESDEDSLLNKRDPVKVFIVRFGNADTEFIISNTIQRVITNSDATIHYMIQHNNTVILCDSILPNDTTIYTSNLTIYPQKGDLIFFRMHSDDKSAIDEVVWDPILSEDYPPVNISTVDADEKERFIFQYSEDAVIHDRQYFIAPFSGNIVLRGNINSPEQSDSLLFLIKHNQTALMNQQYTDAQAFDQNFNYNLSISEGDSILFKLLSNTNVNWNDIDFTAKILYYNIEGQAVDTTSSYYTHKYYPSLQMSIYPHFIIPTRPHIFAAGSYDLLPQIDCQNLMSNYTGTIFFTAKTRRKLLNKRVLHFVNGTLQGGIYANSLQFTLSTADTVYFDYYSKDIIALNTLWSGSNSAAIENPDGTLSHYGAGVSIEYPEKTKILGNLYRGWGQFSYLDTNYTPCNPIDTSTLKFDETLVDTTAWANLSTNIDTTWTINDITDEFDALGMPDVNSLVFSPMYADRENNKWIDFCKSAYVEREIMGSASIFSYLYDIVNDTSIFDPEDQDIPDFNTTIPQSSGGYTVLAPNKKARQNTDAFTFKYGLNTTGSLSTSVSITTSKSFLDYMDMNGDRYPDLVGKEMIQYSPPQGGISGKKQNFSKVFTSFGRGYSIGAAAGVKGVLHRNTISSDTDNSKVENILGSAGIGANYGSSSVHYIYIDINGDGLPDRINQKDNTVCYNTGYNFEAPQTLSTLNNISKSKFTAESANLSTILDMNKDDYSWAFGIGGGLNTSKEKITPMDINNDGLVDICYIEGGDLKAKINNGNGFNSETMETGIDQIAKTNSTNLSADVAATFGIPILVSKVTGSGYADVSYSISRDNYRFSDINGDGFVDKLYIDNSIVYVEYGIPKKTNILQSVKTPTYSTYTVDYEMTYPSRENPQSKWVMASLQVYDAFNGDGVDNMYYTYSYDNPKYHRMERESFGFDTVTTKQNNQSGTCYRYTKEIFHNHNFLFKGLKKFQGTYDGNDNPYVKTDYIWDCKEIRSGQVVPNCSDMCFGPVYPAISEEHTYYHEGQTTAQIHSYKWYQHGRYGNIIAYENHADVADNTDNIRAEISYAYDIPQHFLAMADEIEVFDYQNNLLTRRIASYNSSGKADQIGVYDGANYAYTDISYDQYGNIALIEYPADVNNDRLYYSYQYDPILHTYPVQITDFWGHSSYTAYDYRLGLPLEVTDPTGNQMHFSYYIDGKLKSVTGPKEIASAAPYTILCDYWTNYGGGYLWDRWATTRHHDPINNGNKFITANFSDGLGRNIQTKKTATINGVDSVVISGKVNYDYYGRAISVSQPATEAIGPIIQFQQYTNYNPVNLSTVSYDVMDRPLTETAPDNRTVSYAYDFGTDAFGKTCFETQITDPENNTTTQYKEVRGLQTSITAPLNTTTKFTYSPLGQLLSSTDPENNTTLYAYDMLGRLIERQHPDANTTTYTYDAVGNILSTQTANLQTNGDFIYYIYQDCRLVGIEYPENPELNVNYAYGNSGNETGRLILQEDASGLQQFSYGNMGEITEIIRTFVMPNQQGNGPITLAMQFEYDSWNRTKSITYADGEEVFYGYDNGGQLTEMYGIKSGQNYDYLDFIHYNKYGSRTKMRYANNIETTYSYHPLNQRLVLLEGEDLNSNEIVQRVEYKYDDADNITYVGKTADRGVNGLPYNAEMEYGYDNLYRLTSANGFFQKQGGNPTIGLENYSLSYSPSGNILNKNVLGSTYQNGQIQNVNYDHNYNYSSRPHVLGEIWGSSQQTFEWDENGNMTYWDNSNSQLIRRMMWDEENRLKHVYDEEYTLSSYLYDAGGERTLKLWDGYQYMMINGQQQIGFFDITDYTLYTSPYMVLTPEQYTKHYYAESDRIVSKIGGGMQDNIYTIGDQIYGFNLISHGDYLAKADNLYGMIQNDYNQLNVSADLNPNFDYWLNDAINQDEYEEMIFFYHKDHLGSSTQISDPGANIIQHIEYLPYGELFFERRMDYWNTPYKFNAKELDEETGMYYYGARYYTPEVSIWLSVDPLADKYPSMSPYIYCAGNPVILVDPNGMDWFLNEETGQIQYQKDLRKNDAESLGENWAWLGKNEMFGESPDKLYNDFTGVESQSEEYTSFGFNAEDSEKFMDERGYKKVDKQQFVYEESANERINTGGRYSNNQLSGTTITIGEKKTYVPKPYVVTGRSNDYIGTSESYPTPSGWTGTIYRYRSTLSYGMPKNKSFIDILVNIATSHTLDTRRFYYYSSWDKYPVNDKSSYNINIHRPK
jgi:RHS repeat-associated protein